MSFAVVDVPEPRLSLDAIDDQHEGVVQGSLDVAPAGSRRRHGMGVIGSEYFVTKQSRRTLQRADLARVKHEVAGSPGGVANRNEFNRVAGVDEQPARLTVVLSREGDRLPDRRLQVSSEKLSQTAPHLTVLTPNDRPLRGRGTTARLGSCEHSRARDPLQRHVSGPRGANRVHG